MAKHWQKGRWSRSGGKRVLDDIKRSGLLDSTFATKHGIDPQRISKWRTRLGRPRSLVRASDAKTRRSNAVARRQQPTAQFVEVSGPAAMPARIAEIRLRNGRSVIVTLDKSWQDLIALLDVVERSAC